jgi:predicted ATPase
MKPYIWFITGANGAGKSTLVPLLKKLLSDEYAIHDFDQRGVPNNVTTAGRQQTTRYWLAVAKKHAIRNRRTVICGLVMPSEVYAAIPSTLRQIVRIALLDYSARQLSIRIRRRYRTPAQIRHLKAVTGLSVDECVVANIRHAQRLRREGKRYHVPRFITTKSLPTSTAQKVARWISVPPQAGQKGS